MKVKAWVALTLAGIWMGLGLAAPTQKSVVPDWLRQQALAWQVLAPTTHVPVETVVLWYTMEEPSPEHLAQLAAMGYTVVGVIGRMVTVAAPVTLYIDAEKGLDSLGFLGVVLPNVLLRSEVPPPYRPEKTWPIVFGHNIFCY